MKLLPYVIVLGLGAIVGSSARGLEPWAAAQGNAPSRWEYASVEFSDTRGAERVLVCAFRDSGCELLSVASPAPPGNPRDSGVALALDARVVAAIARLGLDGWELVGDGATGRCEACTRFYFKRPRPR